MGQTNPPFMSGVPESLLSRLLKQQEIYGYELVRTIRKVAGEAISLGEGVIYPVLHCLERARALKSKRKAVGVMDKVLYSCNTLITFELGICCLCETLYVPETLAFEVNTYHDNQNLR